MHCGDGDGGNTTREDFSQAHGWLMPPQRSTMVRSGTRRGISANHGNLPGTGWLSTRGWGCLRGFCPFMGAKFAAGGGNTSRIHPSAVDLLPLDLVGTDAAHPKPRPACLPRGCSAEASPQHWASHRSCEEVSFQSTAPSFPPFPLIPFCHWNTLCLRRPTEHRLQSPPQSPSNPDTTWE